MLTMTKSIIALGVLGAMFLGSPSSSLARDVRAQAQATEYGFGVPSYGNRGNRPGAYAQVSPGYRYGRGWEGLGYGYDSPPIIRPGLAWDPYGLRWDGGN